MARINVDDSAFLDLRFVHLGQLLGTNRHDALGRCAAIWRECQHRERYTLKRWQIDAAAERPGFADLMVEAELARSDHGSDDVYVVGSKGRIEWLAVRRERARTASAARWKPPRHPTTDPTTDPTKDPKVGSDQGSPPAPAPAPALSPDGEGEGSGEGDAAPPGGGPQAAEAARPGHGEAQGATKPEKRAEVPDGTQNPPEASKLTGNGKSQKTLEKKRNMLPKHNSIRAAFRGDPDYYDRLLTSANLTTSQLDLILTECETVYQAKGEVRSIPKIRIFIAHFLNNYLRSRDRPSATLLPADPNPDEAAAILNLVTKRATEVRDDQT